MKVPWIAALCASAGARNLLANRECFSRAKDGDGGRWVLVTSTKRRRLLDAYRFPGFRPVEEVRGMFGDPHARIVTLVRRSKKRPVGRADENIPVGTIARFAAFEIFRPAACVSSWSSRCGGARSARAAKGSATGRRFLPTTPPHSHTFFFISLP